MSTPIVVAHRGLHDVHPENSLAAFRAAWEAGITWCECDVRGSFGHEPFVIHDETLDRTTRGKGPVHHASTRTLRELDVPSLESLIGILPATGKLLIEIKPDVSFETIGRTVELADPRTCVIQSFDRIVLVAAWKTRPEFEQHLLVEDAGARGKPMTGPWSAVNAEHKTLTSQLVASLREQRLKVGAWTVNDDPDIRRMIELEIDMIISDRPLRVRDICNEIA
jgi:glycerophosphoryl diester phosphodiesterase